MKNIEIIIILLILFYYMNRSKKENFGHNFWDCKDNDCRMFHSDVCSDSDIEDGKCPTNKLKIYEEYKKNKKTTKFHNTKKNIANSIMFKNQQKDKTTSHHAQVNVCPEGNAGFKCRQKKECKNWGRKWEGNRCKKNCLPGTDGENCRMLNCLTKSAKDIFNQKCNESNYKDFFKGKLKGNFDVNKLTRSQCNEYLYTLFELYGGKPRDSSRPKEAINLGSNMCKDLNTVSGKNNCYNDVITQISKDVLKMNDSDIKNKLNCKNTSISTSATTKTEKTEKINLKQHENIPLQELCKKFGM